jgi:uncharacterized protein (UPF0333 family)
MREAVRIIKSKKGQQTVEFLLMLGAVVSFVLAFVFTFHKQLAGGFFTIIGNILS